MENTKSFNSKTLSLGSGVLQLMRTIGMTVMTVTAVLVLVGTMLGLAGCSGNKSKSAASNSPKQDSSAMEKHDPVTPVAVTTPAKPTVKKKSAARRPVPEAYVNSNYGVSFRFPREYKLITPNDDLLAVFPDYVPTNFSQVGGETMATLERPDGSSTSFFSVSALKDLTAQQCEKFAVPDPLDVAANSPVDSNDGSLPSKTSIHGMEFSKVENATEQEDVKYYHHFEPSRDGSTGTCYEFAMGVKDSIVSSKTKDDTEIFDKLDRIMSTVTIKSDSTSTATVTVPTKEVPSVNPQQ